MKKTKVTVNCTECDSTYKLDFCTTSVSSELAKYCSFCGAELEFKDDEEIETIDEDANTYVDWE